jgi:crossover junction endodeoxyribonuclease RusA
LLPFEFILDGPPVSQQARRRDRLRAWKVFVRQEAERYWPQGELPTAKPVMLRVTYFYDTISVDVDNIIKPIQDALIGLIYASDDQITDVLSRKRNLNGNFRMPLSSVLAEGFLRGNDFLYVRIEEAPNQEDLD